MKTSTEWVARGGERNGGKEAIYAVGRRGRGELMQNATSFGFAVAKTG